MKRYWFIGIAGSAMASVAGALAARGRQVSGSDIGVYPPMSEYLRDCGISFADRFDTSNISAFLQETAPGEEALVVIGNAVSRGNAEVEETLNRRVPYTSLAMLVGAEFIAGSTSVVVTGTHGKTTTTSLMAWVLESASRAPGFLVGGIPANFGVGCRVSAPGGVFVTEGDEYDTAFFDKRSKFLHYRPDIAVINNVEFDHADIFASLDEVKRSFRSFVNLIPGNGLLLVNGDDPNAMDVASGAHTRVWTFGSGARCDWRFGAFAHLDGGSSFEILAAPDSAFTGEYRSVLAGEFNARNTLAVIAMSAALGLTPDEVRTALPGFRSIRRRMEVIGEGGGITVIDDFAHHPTAVRLTLEALRERYSERRILALFEPRSNTTTRSVFQDELAESFDPATVVIIGAINRPERYAADERLSPERLCDALRTRGIEAMYIPDPDDMVRRVLDIARPGDVIALLSNGKFGGAHAKIVSALPA